MKNRIWIVFLLVCLVCTICTGCSENTTNPSFTPQPTPEKTLGILDGKVSLPESDNLFYIPNEAIEKQVGQSLYSFQGNLLSSCIFFDAETEMDAVRLTLISCETGKTLYETVIKDIIYTTVQILNNEISVYDRGSGSLWILNEQLQIAETMQLEPGDIYFDPTRTYQYTVTLTDGIEMQTISTGERKTILANGKDITVLAVEAEQMKLSYINENTLLEETAVLTLKTGELSNGPENTFISTLAEDGSMELYYYDTNGKFVSSCMKKETAGIDPLYSLVEIPSCDGRFFTIMNAEGKEHLYFWDFSVKKEGENLKTETLEIPGIGTAVSEAYYKQAQELSKTYGVSIKIAELFSQEYALYTTQQEFTESNIAMALNVIEAVLESYPDNFISQLSFGTIHHVEIQLTGKIDWKQAGETVVTSILGFMETRGNKAIIALDICNQTEEVLKRTLYHEFSHVIEEKLKMAAMYRENALFSEAGWASFNPDGFEYVGQQEPYPDYFSSYEYSLHFIDAYSGTVLGEDMARVMEYAAVGNKNVFIGHPGIISKLQYYCDCIRDLFDTTGWPEQTPWEQTSAQLALKNA